MSNRQIQIKFTFNIQIVRAYSVASPHPLPDSIQSPRACLASEFDLEVAIRTSIEQLNIQFERRHVLGHQDDQETHLEVLPWPAQLNVVCDRLASINCTSHPVTQPCCTTRTATPMSPCEARVARVRSGKHYLMQRGALACAHTFSTATIGRTLPLSK